MARERLDPPVDLEASKYRQKIESLTTELTQTEASQKPSALPKRCHVWDIAFVEIFESEKDGFDIVMATTIVRQEAIADPRTHVTR
jgi:hypothetical protein